MSQKPAMPSVTKLPSGKIVIRKDLLLKNLSSKRGDSENILSKLLQSQDEKMAYINLPKNGEVFGILQEALANSGIACDNQGMISFGCYEELKTFNFSVLASPHNKFYQLCVKL